jgi:hypothetical protein
MSLQKLGIYPRSSAAVLPQSGQEIQFINHTHVKSRTAEIQSVIEFDVGRVNYPIGLVMFQPGFAKLVGMGAPPAKLAVHCSSPRAA